MAIFRSGLGEVKGKYGNLITYVVKGQNRVRATPLRYKDANTEEQQKQRTRLKFVCKFYSYAMQEPLLKEVWRAAAVPTPYDRYVLFRKVNMNACTADFTIGDYTQLHLAQGTLAKPLNMRFDLDESDNLIVTWENHLDYLASRADDELRIAFLRGDSYVAQVMGPTGRPGRRSGRWCPSSGKTAGRCTFTCFLPPRTVRLIRTTRISARSSRRGRVKMRRKEKRKRSDRHGGQRCRSSV